TGYWPGYARRNLKNALPGASICSAAVERSNGFAWESDRGERIVNKRRIGLDCFVRALRVRMNQTRRHKRLKSSTARHAATIGLWAVKSRATAEEAPRRGATLRLARLL